MFKVIFSDGRKIEVSADCPNTARNRAYQYDRTASVIDVVRIG